MAASNINRVVLTGNLTRDPELRSLPSGMSVCSLRLAVNTRRKDASGDWEDKPNYFDVTVWGAQGENCAQYLSKGRPVALDGRLEWREWETPARQQAPGRGHRGRHGAVPRRARRRRRWRGRRLHAAVRHPGRHGATSPLRRPATAAAPGGPGRRRHPLLGPSAKGGTSCPSPPLRRPRSPAAGRSEQAARRGRRPAPRAPGRRRARPPR